MQPKHLPIHKVDARGEKETEMHMGEKETGTEPPSSSLALPCGLRDVSSVVIVWDKRFGPRLRRVLDEVPCEPAMHAKRRHPELFQVKISRARVKSAGQVSILA